MSSISTKKPGRYQTLFSRKVITSGSADNGSQAGAVRQVRTAATARVTTQPLQVFVGAHDPCPVLIGRHVPGDFGVVGFSNWQIASVVSPDLTTVAQPGSEMGKIAARLLIQRIEHPEKYQEHFPSNILKTQLIVRGSSYRGMQETSPQ